MVNIKIKNIGRFALSVGLAVTVPSGNLLASESFQTTKFSGRFDIRSAMLPPKSGAYLFSAFNQAITDKVTDENGESRFPDTDGVISLGIFGLMYVFPKQILGGKIAANIGAAYVQNQLTITELPVAPQPLVGDNTGVGDMEVNLVWSRDVLHAMDDSSKRRVLLPSGTSYSLGIGLASIIGSQGYDPDSGIAQPSSGTQTLSFSAALTHATRPLLLDGTEFSIHSSFNYVAPRESLGGFEYQDGSYAIFDFALTERFKMFQFGLAGSYANQFEEDQGTPIVSSDLRGQIEILKLGAIVAMDIGPGTGLKLKYLKDVDAKDTYQGHSFALSFGLKL